MTGARAQQGSGAQAMQKFGWSEINGMVELLADGIEPRSVECIVGISRSGLVPAVILSHMLGIRPFSALDIVRTASDEIQSAKGLPVLRGVLNPENLAGRRVLVVDDIVGQGLTMGLARQALIDLGA
jgi:hypoxanthine phosphoribosyltransferase